MSFAGYKCVQRLGEGTYCTINKAIYEQTGEHVVIKVLRTDTDEDGVSPSTLREASILKAVKHVNIISLRDVVWKETKLGLVLEYMDSNLRRYLHHRGVLHSDLLRSYAYQLLCGVYYLHTRGVIHRDIRPEHMLINRVGLCKLCDFASSVLYSHRLSKFEGEVTTLWYRAPELLIEETHDFAVDLWSCGCVIAEMASGSTPFQGDSPIDQLMKICAIIGTPSYDDWPDLYHHVSGDAPLPKGPFPGAKGLVPGDADPALVDLLKKLLTLNPENRITAKDAVQHPYFSEVPPTLVDMSLRTIQHM